MTPSSQSRRAAREAACCARCALMLRRISDPAMGGAYLTLLNTLANVKAALGSLERVSRIVFVSGFVNAVDGFADSPAVINGASDLFVKVFGDAGRHARAAVAVNGLPRGATAEIPVVVEVRD